MDRKNIVWTLMPLLLVPLGVAETTDPLTDLEYIAGKLVFYQMEGNATYIRDTGELASNVPTETMFESFDLQKNYTTAKFTYMWDLGNGEVIQGTEPVVRYHYSESGNYTLRLKVGVNMTEDVPPVTGVYSTNVQVLDAIKQINLKEPSYYEVSQDISLAFHVDGSPPMWVCWSFIPNCVPDMTGGCTLTMLYGNSLQLNHTFASAGVYCLDISIRNGISQMQTSFSLNVRTNYNTHLFFIVCAAVLVATIFFITVITCSSHRRSRSQIAASSNSMFLKNEDYDGQSMRLLNFSTVEGRDKEPLLLQYGTQYSS